MSPERRPAKKVTWGGMDVVVGVVDDVDGAPPPPDEV